MEELKRRKKMDRGQYRERKKETEMKGDKQNQRQLKESEG
jgi:hypothetical protein